MTTILIHNFKKFEAESSRSLTYPNHHSILTQLSWTNNEASGAQFVLCNCKEKQGPTTTGSISVMLSWAIEQSQEQAACVIPVKIVVCVFRCAIPRFCNYSIATYGIFYHSIRGHETKSGCRSNFRFSLYCSTIVFSNLDMVTRLQSCNVLAMAHSSQLPKHLFWQQSL